MLFRSKRTGSFMAFITVEDVYGSLDCVCFPAVYEKFKGEIANDKIVKVKGKLDVDAEKGISLIVDEIMPLESGGEKPAEAKSVVKRPVLWLNAKNLDDEAFDEFLNMLSNYEGDTVCKIVRGSERYMLPSGVNYCRGLLAELCSFIELEDIKYVDN